VAGDGERTNRETRNISHHRRRCRHRSTQIPATIPSVIPPARRMIDGTAKMATKQSFSSNAPLRGL
jgi:hypothetical protein